MIRRAIAAAVIALAAIVPGPADGTAVPVPAPLADERFVDWPTEVVLPVPPATPEPPQAARTARSALVVASWYADKLRPAGAVYAAMHRYRWGDPVTHVQVCSYDGRTRCVTVPVVDHCQCYVGTPDERGIDLSPAAFAQLAPLWRGLIRVSVKELE